MGVGDVLLRLDLQTERYDLVRSDPLWRLFSPTPPPGLDQAKTFGTKIPGKPRFPQIDERTEVTPPGQSPPPGEPPEPQLVNKLAELKMIRSLQVRIYNRTQRYGQMIGGDQAETAELLDALKELAERQQRVYQATSDLQLGRND